MPIANAPWILDTDPGIDDALALFMLLGSTEVDLLGLTTVFGNASVQRTTRNALQLLELASARVLGWPRGRRYP